MEGEEKKKESPFVLKYQARDLVVDSETISTFNPLFNNSTCPISYWKRLSRPVVTQSEES